MVEEKYNYSGMGNYFKLLKVDLIKKVKGLEMNIRELRREIKNNKLEIKWAKKMKIEEVKRLSVEIKVMNVRLPIATAEFIEKHNIDLKKLIVVAVEELKKQV